MAIVQLISPGGQIYDVEESEAESAMAANNLVPATPEQVAQYDAELNHGGFVDELKTIGEEAVRSVASGAAAVGRAVTPETPAGLTDLEPGQVDRVGTGEGIASNVGLEGVYGEDARARRLANPIAAGIGGTLPALPLYAAGGIAADFAADAVTGAMTAAVDAELENREVTGSDVLRNAGLNMLWSSGAHGLGYGARQVLRGGRNIIDIAGERAAQRLAKRGAGSQGDDLVEAMNDPVARDQFFADLNKQTDQVLTEIDTSLQNVKPSKVANNPNAQRTAIEDIGDVFEATDPGLVAELRKLEKGTPASRLNGLRSFRDKLSAESPLAEPIDALLGREDLWGADALRSMADINAALKAKPPAGAGFDALQEYAQVIGKIPGQEKQAAKLNQLIDQGNQARVASTMPPKVTPREAPSIVDDAPRTKTAIRDAVVGPGAKTGALQSWTDDFADLVSNAEKRETFTTFEATMDPAAREALAARSREIASEAVDVITKLPDTAQERILGFAEALEKSGSAADMDRLKNALQSLRKRYAKATNDVRADDYVEAIDSIEPKIRAALEDPQFVGEVTAGVQKARNAAWSNPESGFIRNQNRMKAAGYNLLDTVEIGYDGKALLQTDAKAFESLLNAPPDQALKVLSYWDEQIKAAKNIVATVTKAAEGGPLAAKAERFTKSTAELQRQINTIRKIKMAEDVVSRAEAPGFFARVGDRLIKGAASGQSGVIGAVAGTAVEAALPKTRAVYDFASEKVLQAAVAMREAAINESRWTAKLLTNPEQSRTYLRVAGDVAAAIDRFTGEHERPEQAFVEHRAMIEGFAQNPERLVNLLTEEFGEIGELSPKLQREMIAQASRVAAYLQQHLPGRRNVSVVYRNGTGASAMEIRQFAMRFTAATDPASVLADARAGRLQKVQLDTLQELWPDEYNRLRNSVIEEMGTGRLSTRTRQMMSLLFGFDSGIDPALGARTRKIVEAARAQQEKSEPQSPPPSMNRSRLPSTAGLTPGGMAALQLGSQLSF